MALTESNMLPLGTTAPSFNLPDVISGQEKSFTDVRGSKATVVMFICNHCPYVVHLKQHFAEFAKEYQRQGLGVVAISSNDVDGYPQDGPDAMADDCREYAYPFPYLYDQDQHVARAYEAACTPDFYLFDENRKLVYRGQYDGSRPRNAMPVTGSDLRAAVDAVLAGQDVNPNQVASMGCNIKWKAGNEPDYFYR